VSNDSPSAKAAQTSARFVRLFDPGGRILPRTGPTGRISIFSMSLRLLLATEDTEVTER
jgi:hypothetical protein